MPAPLQLLSIVIPARDEEGCIASTVEHLDLELRLRGVPHEIVVVDDGSTDATWEILQSVREKIPALRPVKSPGPHGFGGDGKQVRDCLHPRDLCSVLLRQIDEPSRAGPRVCNFSGGSANSMSLRELSDWCLQRFPGLPSPVVADAIPQTRPFDIPWIFFDPSRAFETWHWLPPTPLEDLLEEIARHAVSNPDWLDLVAG